MYTNKSSFFRRLFSSQTRRWKIWKGGSGPLSFRRPETRRVRGMLPYEGAELLCRRLQRFDSSHFVAAVSCRRVLCSYSRVRRFHYRAGLVRKAVTTTRSRDAYATSSVLLLWLHCSSVCWTSLYRRYLRRRKLLRATLETVFTCYLVLIIKRELVSYSCFDRFRSSSLSCIFCYLIRTRSLTFFLLVVNRSPSVCWGCNCSSPFFRSLIKSLNSVLSGVFTLTGCAIFCCTLAGFVCNALTWWGYT